MFLARARTLADLVSEKDLAAGSVYPPLTDIRRLSLALACAVADEAFEQGLAQVPRPADLAAAIAATMYDPTY